MENDLLSQPEQRNIYRSRLIEFVRANPILWDKKSMDFTQREVKTQKWLEVAETLGVSISKVRRTWENLRDQYRRDLKRIIKTGARSQWRFFDDMNFIRSMVRIKSTEYRSKSESDSEYEDLVGEHNFAVPPATPTTTAPAVPELVKTDFVPIQLSTEWRQLTEIQQLQQIQQEAPSGSEQQAQKLEQQHCDSSEDQKFNGIELVDVSNVIKIEMGSDSNDQRLPLVLQQHPTPQLTQELPRDPRPAMPNTHPSKTLSEPCVSTSGSSANRRKRRPSTADAFPQSDFKHSCHRQRPDDAPDVGLQDEDYHFVMSVLPSLRQVARHRKFPLRSQIMTLISKELGESYD